MLLSYRGDQAHSEVTGMSPGKEFLASPAPSVCKVRSVQCVSLIILDWPFEFGCPLCMVLDADPALSSLFVSLRVGLGGWGSGPPVGGGRRSVQVRGPRWTERPRGKVRPIAPSSLQKG